LLIDQREGLDHFISGLILPDLFTGVGAVAAMKKTQHKNVVFEDEDGNWSEQNFLDANHSRGNSELLSCSTHGPLIKK